MKTKTFQFRFPFKKNFLFGVLFLCGFLLSSYKSSACTASFTYTVAVNGHYSFTSTSAGVGAGTQYSWNPGDGSGWHYGGISFAYTYTANATYQAKLAIYDSMRSCIDTAKVSITVSNVNTPCTLAANFSYSVGAHGVVTFTSTSHGTNAYTQYYWSPGDSNQRVRGTSSLVHKYVYQGYYGVWLIIQDTGLSYCIDSIYKDIYVGTADSSHCHLHANFTYTQGANGDITFTNTSTGTKPGDQYFWYLGNAQLHYGAGPFSNTFALNGTYYVTISVQGDSNNCSDSLTLPVVVTNACNLQASFSVVYDTGANAGKAHFTSTSVGVNGGTIYKWTFGDGSPTVTGGDTISHQYSFIGYYNVTLTDSNPNGCVDSYSELIYIYNKDSLQACFTYHTDSLNVPGEYDFNAGCSKGTNVNTYYKWTPGDGDPADSGLGMSTYKHTYLHNGPYSATLDIWYTILPHRVGSSPRFDESSYTLVINVSTALGIASITDASNYTIYPNPSNGSFNIAMSGLANDKNAEVRISNMMGQVIYQANQTISGGNTLSEVSLPNAANGIYLLQIITQDNTYTSRIAIQK